MAFSVTFCAVPTQEVLAVKAALVAPAGTVTAGGTDTATLLLARLTVNPPAGAAPFSFTAQASLTIPETDVLPQLSEANAVPAGSLDPVKPIVMVHPAEELV